MVLVFNEFLQVLPYVLAATAAGILAGLLPLVWSPGVHARSAIQHFAAGVVIAAVASDLVPEVEKIGRPAGILLGFAGGGVFMIGLKWLVVTFEKREKAKRKLPIGIAAAAAVDTLVDGALISAGFSTGQHVGSLLAIALAIELFFLTLSVGSEFHKSKASAWLGIAVTTGIALLMLVGAFVGFLFFRGLSEPSLAIVLSFGAAALIYLIAEELLVEAIEAEESLFSTATLFAGFLVLLAIKLVTRG
jgi:zinc transporter, ZIP family